MLLYSLLEVFVLLGLPRDLVGLVVIRRSTIPIGDQTEQQHLEKSIDRENHHSPPRTWQP